MSVPLRARAFFVAPLALLAAGMLLPVAYACLVCLAAWLHVIGLTPFLAVRVLLNLGWIAVAAVALRAAQEMRRPWVGLGALAGVLLLILLAPSFACGFVVYRAKVLAMGERARPMIAAIRQYEADHGVPPGNLGALVPEYLPAGIPTTGIAASPEFAYTYYRPNRGRNATWGLWIPPPDRRFLSLDAGVRYEPSGEYAQDYERIGDWGYHHD